MSANRSSLWQESGLSYTIISQKVSLYHINTDSHNNHILLIFIISRDKPLDCTLVSITINLMYKGQMKFPLPDTTNCVLYENLSASVTGFGCDKGICCDVWEGAHRSPKDSGTRAGNVWNVVLSLGRGDRLLYLSDVIYNRTSRLGWPERPGIRRQRPVQMNTLRVL